MSTDTTPQLPGRLALLTKFRSDETSRSITIYPPFTTPEEMKKSLDEGPSLAWMFQDRSHALAKWSEPRVHLAQRGRVHVGTERIRELVDTLDICNSTISEWEHDTPRWRTPTKYRYLADAEALQVGDKIWCASGNGNVATIDRLTPARAYAGATHWPRVFTSKGFRASGRASYSNDLAYRAI